MNYKRFAILPLLILMLSPFGFAQENDPYRNPPRPEDHFYRKRVVLRIDLEEKINLPMITAVPNQIYSETAFTNNNGIIASLFGGLKNGKYLAIDPNDLNKTMTYDDFVAKANEIDPGMESDTAWESVPDWEIDIDGEEGEDPFLVEEGDNDPFETGDMVSSEEELDLSPYEMVIEIVEDRIFDKNRSDMVYDIQFIRVVWVDPMETLPDKLIAVFKYDEVVNTLEETMWVNNHNDAEARNLREILELRNFNGYAINVSGRGVRSLPEAQFRANQLVEFEHNLWSY